MTLIIKGGPTPNFSQQRAKPRKLEQGIHLAVAHHIRLLEPQYPQLRLAYHCPSGGKRSKVEAAIFQRMLVRPGIPDLCLPFPGYNWALDGGDEARNFSVFSGMFMELKSPDGKLSEEQANFMRAVSCHKWLAVCCFSYETAIARIKDYLGPSRWTK